MMKALVQRVTQAKVTVDGEIVSSIGKGLCVFIGITRKDTPREMEYIARKILSLRVFEDDQGKKWSKNVMDKNYEVLCVSQFTLCVTMKGNKPDFHDAMGPDTSQEFYSNFVRQMEQAYDPSKIKDGVFGAYMQVHIQNDGPVTIPLDTPAYLQEENKKQKKWNNKPPVSAKNKSSNAAASQSAQVETAQTDTLEPGLEAASAMSTESTDGTQTDPQQDQS